jgi:hypothetical protein
LSSAVGAQDQTERSSSSCVPLNLPVNEHTLSRAKRTRKARSAGRLPCRHHSV